MKFAVKLLLPTLAALALAGCGADLAPKPTALWQSMPSLDPEPMVESWWRLADKGDGLVRVETRAFPSRTKPTSPPFIMTSAMRTHAASS